MAPKTEIKMKWMGGKITAAVALANRKAIGEIAEDLLTEATKIVPLDENPLMTSGDIDIESTPMGASATVFYDTKYAARLHEHPEYNFQNGREGKYLEKPLKENALKYQAWLQSAYHAVFQWRK